MIENISDLIPRIIPEVPGAPDAIVRFAIQEAMRDFCVKTDIFTHDVLTINMVSGTATYTIAPIPYDAAIHRIMWVKVKTSTSDDFDDIAPSDCRFYQLVAPTTLKFLSGMVPSDTISSGIGVRVSLRPELECEEYPSLMLDKYAEYVVSKSKAILMNMPRKPFSNPQRAMQLEQHYAEGVAFAEREKVVEGLNTQITTTQFGVVY